MTPKAQLSDAACVAAIHDESLRSVAPVDSPAFQACERIEDRVGGAARDLIELLSAAGITAERTSEPKIYDLVELTVAEPQFNRAMSVVEDAGYRRWVRLVGGALRCYLQLEKSMMFIADGEHMVRVVLRWGDAVSLPARLRPHLTSLASVDLPAFAWPAYLAVHPVRQLLNRVRGGDHTPEDRPFLGTPSSLLEPLFAAVDLDDSDVFVDVGCGDGRVAIEAARRYGCTARGIEYHPDIAEQARKRVLDAGMAEQVSISQGDATEMDLSDATVIFVFLPVSLLRQLLPKLLEQVEPGTRIVTHEIAPFPSNFEPQPDRQFPVVGHDAVTVGHLWMA